MCTSSNSFNTLKKPVCDGDGENDGDGDGDNIDDDDDYDNNNIFEKTTLPQHHIKQGKH
jgi:hypothetical protein